LDYLFNNYATITSNDVKSLSTMQCLKELKLQFCTFGSFFVFDDRDFCTSIAHAAGQVPNLERFWINHDHELVKGNTFVEQYGKLYPARKLMLEEHQ
jgi:hypothetical protein